MIPKIRNQFQQLWNKGFFHLAVSNYSVQFIVFSSHLLIAKIMSPDDVGLIKSIETFVSIAVIIGGGGSILALIKLIPQRTESIFQNLILRLSTRSTTIVSIITLLLFWILIFVSQYFDWFPTSKWYYIYALIITPTALTQLFIRYYQATDNFKRISVINLISKMIAAILVLGCTYYFYISGYVYSMIFSAVLTLVILWYDLRKELTQVHAKIDNEIEFYKEFKSLSKDAFHSQIVDQIKLNIGFIVSVLIIIDPTEFGYYAFALILVQGLNVLVSSIQQFILPRLAASANHHEIFFGQIKYFERRFMMLTIVLFILAQLLAPFFILLIFGEQYRSSIPLFQIMLIGWLIFGLSIVRGLAFVSIGKMKYISYSSALTIVIATPIMIGLTIQYGALGAALSFLVQSLVNTICVLYFVEKLKKNK